MTSCNTLTAKYDLTYEEAIAIAYALLNEQSKWTPEYRHHCDESGAWDMAPALQAALEKFKHLAD